MSSENTFKIRSASDGGYRRVRVINATTNNLIGIQLYGCYLKSIICIGFEFILWQDEYTRRRLSQGPSYSIEYAIPMYNKIVKIESQGNNLNYILHRRYGAWDNTITTVFRIAWRASPGQACFSVPYYLRKMVQSM